MRVERIEQALLPMARTALDAGQVGTARRLYSRLLEADPESADARMGLGDVALADRDVAQAATWYLAAVTQADGPATRHAALLAHGRAALADADVEAARESFSRLTDPAENASRSHAAWGFNGIGVIRLLEGKPAEAVVAIERAVLLDADEPRFHANLTRAARIAASYPVEPSAGAVVRVPTPDRDDPLTSPSSDGAEAQTVDASVPQDADRPGSLEAFALGASSTSQPEPESETALTEAPGPDTEPPPVPQPVPQPVPPPSPAAGGGEQEREAAPPAPATLRRPPPDPPSGEAPQPFPEGAFFVRTEGGDYLQVGAYSIEAHAMETAAALRETTGLPVRVERALRDERLLYRVHVGPVPTDALPNLASARQAEAAFELPADGTDAATNVVPRIAVEGGKTFLEVAEYEDYAAAEALVRRLRDGTGHPVELSKVSRGGSPSVYRVRVGPVPGAPPTLIEEIARIRENEHRPR